MPLTLILETGEYAVAKLPASAPLPSWLPTTSFSSVSRAHDELSVICLAEAVPAGVETSRGWRLLRFVGPFPFTATGILNAVLSPLAAAGIGIVAVSTFNTDYVLVPAAAEAEALSALQAAGHTVQRASISPV